MNDAELNNIANEHVKDISGRIDVELTLIEDATLYEENFNVYFYQSKKFLKTESIDDMLAGNSPFIVTKEDGKIYTTGTAYDIDYYIENFKKYGDPNPIEVQKANLEKDFNDSEDL